MSDREFKVGDLVAYDMDSWCVSQEDWKCVGIVIPHDWKELGAPMTEERKEEINEFGHINVYWFIGTPCCLSTVNKIVEATEWVVHLTKQELSRREEKINE